MRYYIVLIISFFIILNCTAQGQQNTIANIESSLKKYERHSKIPCAYIVTFDRRDNGRGYFTTKDSAELEFDFFKIINLPFFNTSQSSAETISSYYNWLVKEKDFSNNIKLSKIDENTDDSYSIYKIQDASGDCYRLLGIKGNVLISIKLLDRKMPVENQIERLQTLYALNKEED